MEEIEVEEYVRTEKGTIAKIEDIEWDLLYEIVSMKVKYKHWIDRNKCRTEYIVKHNKDITYLIKVGDYVNGEKVTAIFDLFNSDEEKIGKRLTTEYRTAQYNGLDRNYYIYNNDIKSIVTKEQFNSIAYRLEE